MEAYERHTGKVHPELADEPELPSELIPLWVEFLELHGMRNFTPTGPARLTHKDFFYFEQVRETKFKPWELDMIQAADREYIKSLPKKK